MTITSGGGNTPQPPQQQPPQQQPPQQQPPQQQPPPQGDEQEDDSDETGGESETPGNRPIREGGPDTTDTESRDEERRESVGSNDERR